MLTATRTGVILAILLGLAGSLALADGPLPDAGVCSPYYGFWGCGYYPWSGYSLESAPYYAMHPPVYYSYPVPRTYGYSPFPYPPGTRTPEIVPPKPKIIENKFVPRPSGQEPKSDRVTEHPVRISNPFVAQANGSAGKAVVELISTQGIRPKIIYPARLAQPL